MDPNNPQTRQSIQMQTQGGRVPLPGMYTAYPSGGNPVQALIAIDAQLAQKTRRPALNYQVRIVKDLGVAVTGHCYLAAGTVDYRNGKGTFASQTTICMGQPANGVWMLTLYEEDTRPEQAEAMRATFQAMSASYRLNDGVIRQEIQQNIDQIHQIGAESARQAADSHAAFDKRNAGLAAAEDRRDRANQDFSNYQLGNTVIRDTETGEHATGYNQYADSLVRADPAQVPVCRQAGLFEGNRLLARYGFGWVARQCGVFDDQCGIGIASTGAGFVSLCVFFRSMVPFLL